MPLFKFMLTLAGYAVLSIKLAYPDPMTIFDIFILFGDHFVCYK